MKKSYSDGTIEGWVDVAERPCQTAKPIPDYRLPLGKHGVCVGRWRGGTRFGVLFGGRFAVLRAAEIEFLDTGKHPRETLMPHPLIILEEDRDVQKPLIEELTLKRFTVFETSRRVKKCRTCGEYNSSGTGDGVSKGLSDLVITSDEWPAYLAVLIECKGTKTKISPEQKLLAERGRIAIIRTAEEGVRIVQAIDKAIKETFQGGSTIWQNSAQ